MPLSSTCLIACLQNCTSFASTSFWFSPHDPAHCTK
jgi:hypothetical protein